MALNSPTIGSELDKNRGLGQGFDFLRVFLALSVVGFHTFVVLGNPPEWHRITWFMAYWVLAIFFSLSGFLIAGSALRLKLQDFLINRGLRIIPALAVEILLSAFLLGPIFTTLSLHDYFRDPQFFHYLTNIFGWINYELPGVFKEHYSNNVNTSLWTIPYEIGCYAIISAMIYFKLLHKPKLAITGAIWFIAIGLIMTQASASGFSLNRQSTLGQIFDILFCDRGSRLFVSFLLGIAAYLYRYKIPYNFRLFAGMVGFCVAISLLKPGWWNADLSFPLLNLVAAAPLTYIMLYVGVSPMPKLPIFRHGDYSYGIYLYSFPLQQALVSILPTKNPLLHFIAEIAIIVPFAMFSWHVIEKPVLKLRKKFSFVARQTENN